MAVITFQCYACNQVLQVGADKAGRKAKCSQCGTILTIPVLAADVGAVVPGVAAPLPAAPAPPLPRAREALDDVEVVRDERPARPRDDYDEPPPRRRRLDDDYDLRKPAASKWDKVKIGFLLVFIGLCVMAGAYGFQLLGMLVFNAGVAFTLAAVIVRIGVTVIFLGAVTAIVGHVFWIFLTNKHGALGFAIAALSVAGVFVLFEIVAVAQVYSSLFAGSAVGMLTYLLQAAHFMMIAFYVRAIARTFDERRLERGAMLNVILCGCLGGFQLLAGIILLAMEPSAFQIGGGIQGFIITRWILLWLGALATVGVFVFTILAVYQGKKLVDQAAAEDTERYR